MKTTLILALSCLAFASCESTQRARAPLASLTNIAEAPIDRGVRRASLVRVIDGDTVVLAIDLGDGVAVAQRHIRLLDVRCFESGTPEGDMETAAIRKLLSEKKPIVVEMHGKDKYGRMIGTIWIGTTNVNAAMRAMPQGGR